MSRFADSTQFEVKWKPFQLNANGSKEGVNKLQLYMSKFNCTKEQIMSRMGGMKQTFSAAGLPFDFTETSLTGNTFNSHRLISYAGSISDDTQDKVVEALFQAYFADSKFLNSPDVLIDAAVAGGIDHDTAKALVEDESMYSEATAKELEMGTKLGVSGLCVDRLVVRCLLSGVPHFVIEHNGQRAQLGGAQPPQEFEKLFKKLLES